MKETTNTKELDNVVYIPVRQDFLFRVFDKLDEISNRLADLEQKEDDSLDDLLLLSQGSEYLVKLCGKGKPTAVKKFLHDYPDVMIPQEKPGKSFKYYKRSAFLECAKRKGWVK